MEAYYAEIRQSVLLPADEERALFRTYRTCPDCRYRFKVGDTRQVCPRCNAARDLKARDRLVQGALRFVVKVAKDYARRARGMHYESDLLKSLISAGNYGLLVAVDRFEPSRGTRYLTYAAWWVREKILEELDNMGIVRVPAYRQKALRAQRKQGDPAALDTPHVQMEEVSEIDKKHHDDTLESDLVNTYGIDMIYQSLDALELRGRDRYIVLAYFGMREDPKNLRQISNRLGLSSERVRQIKKTVLDLLHRWLDDHAVKETKDVFG